MAKFSTLFLAASMLIAGTAAPAAATEDQPRRAFVSYGDLDLTDGADRERLTARVDRAVRQVCAAETRRDVRAQAETSACRDQARRNADAHLASLFSGNRLALAERGSKFLIMP